MKATTSSDAPSPVRDEVGVVREVGADGDAGAGEDGREERERDREDHRHDEPHDETGEDQPADVSAPKVPRPGEHVADAHVLLPCPLVVDARRPAAPPPAVREFAAVACYPWTRHARLYPQGVPQDRRPGGRRASLAAAGCGSQPAADPPQDGRLSSPRPSPGGKRAGRRAVRRPGRGRRRDHRRRRRRARRDGGLRAAGRRRGHQAQHLHRVPRAGVRRDHQSGGRGDAGRSCACGRRPAGCASWTCPSPARPKRRTA